MQTRGAAAAAIANAMRRIPSTIVKDIARADVVTVAPSATLVQCAQRMREEHVGSVIVVAGEAAGGRAVGIVTDRDIVVESVAAGLNPDTLTAGEVMAAGLAAVSPDDDLLDVLARMREHGVRRVVVTDAAGRAAGIVTMDDLLPAIAQQLLAVTDVVAAEHTKESGLRPAR